MYRQACCHDLLLGRFFLLLAMFATGLSSGAVENEACPLVRMVVERLPDMHIARADHSVFVVGGEPTVVGGHTSGFVPTATAEYFNDGEWHLLQTVYTHDHGFSTPLRSGKVLVGGGHVEPLGIGHIHSVEMYDPATHSFRGFGCLDNKRCFASGIELDSGRVIITGNWFRSDDIEQFDGQKFFTSLGSVSQARACPYVFRIAEDDVIVFGSMDEHGDPIDTIIVDRLRGEPFQVALFNDWKPLRWLVETRGENHCIGHHIYVIPVTNKDGQVAICRVEDTSFTLMPTASPIPMEHDGDHIIYYKSICVDQQVGLAYLFGSGNNNQRLYVAAIGIRQSPSPVTLYYTDPVDPVIWSQPMLTPDGDLLLAGGTGKNADGSTDNFSPVATTLLLHLGNGSGTATTKANYSKIWLWIGLGLLAIGILFGIYKIYKAYKTHAPAPYQAQESIDNDLIQRICQLMDEQKPYLNTELKLQDLADLLGTNRTYLADSIKASCGQTFTQFVNIYRVDYAKKQLRMHPDKKMSAVATESGFTTETHFFRTFKTVTGMTPSEWRVKG